MRTRLYIIIAFIAVISCNKPEEPVIPTLSVGGVGEYGISVDASFCGGVPITVESNVDWCTASDADWVALYPSEGRGKEFCEVSVRFKSRNWADTRSATLTVTAGDRTYSFTASQAAYDPEAIGFDDPEAVVDGHPFLLASGKDFRKIRELATLPGSELNVMHEYVMRFADAALEAVPVKYKLDGTRLIDVTSEALKRVFYLSYAYRITGNPQYASRVETELLAISDFPDWNPSNFIEPSELMAAIAIGYDWCFPRITSNSRDKIFDAMKEKGLDTYFEWGGALNNFNQVCNTGALYGAWAYRERDASVYDAVLERALTMIKVALKGYNPDGTYVEGPGYWCYGTSYNTLFFDFLQRFYGDSRGLLEEFPAFLKTAAYGNAVITPSLGVFDYSDQGFPAQISIVPFYIYDRTGDTDVLAVQMRMLRMSMLNKDHFRHERLLPAAIVYASRRGLDDVQAADVPCSFVGGGETPLAAFRGDSYIAMKLGHPDTGHGHMDIGTFCFESDGVQWSTDMGGEGYTNIEKAGVDLWSYAQGSQRWSLMRCGPQGHSVMIFDGAEQTVSARGDFTGASVSNPADLSATADLSPLYSAAAEHVSRTIRLVDGTVGEVVDSVNVGANATVLRWNMVSEAVGAEFDSRGAVLQNGGSTLRMEVEGPDSFEMKQWSSKPSLSCESSNKEIIVGFEAVLAAGSKNVIKVRLIPNGK